LQVLVAAVAPAAWVALFEKILQDEKSVVTWESRYCFSLRTLPNMLLNRGNSRAAADRAVRVNPNVGVLHTTHMLEIYRSGGMAGGPGWWIFAESRT
jgi:hypothetical protein